MLGVVVWVRTQEAGESKRGQWEDAVASCSTAFNGSRGVCFRPPLAPDGFPVLALAVVGQACRCRRLAALVS